MDLFLGSLCESKESELKLWTYSNPEDSVFLLILFCKFSVCQYGKIIKEKKPEKKLRVWPNDGEMLASLNIIT